MISHNSYNFNDNVFNFNIEEVFDPFSLTNDEPLNTIQNEIHNLNAYQQDSFNISNLLQTQYLSNQINSVNPNSASQTISPISHLPNDMDNEQKIDPQNDNQILLLTQFNDSPIKDNMAIEAPSYSKTNQSTLGNNSLDEDYIGDNCTTLSIHSVLPEQALINPNFPQENEGNIGSNTQSTAISEANSTNSDHKYSRLKNGAKFIWTRLRELFKIFLNENFRKTQYGYYFKVLKDLEIEENVEQKHKNILNPKKKYIGLFSLSVKPNLYSLDLNLSMKIREEFSMYLQANIHEVHESFIKSQAKNANEYYQHFIDELGQAGKSKKSRKSKMMI